MFYFVEETMARKINANQLHLNQDELELKKTHLPLSD